MSASFNQAHQITSSYFAPWVLRNTGVFKYLGLYIMLSEFHGVTTTFTQLVS